MVYGRDERTLSLGHEQSPCQPAGFFANTYLANQPSGFCLGHNPLTFFFIKLIHAPIVTDKQAVYHFFFKSAPKRFLPRHLLPLLLNSLHEVRVHIRPIKRNKYTLHWKAKCLNTVIQHLALRNSQIPHMC